MMDERSAIPAITARGVDIIRGFAPNFSSLLGGGLNKGFDLVVCISGSSIFVFDFVVK